MYLPIKGNPSLSIFLLAYASRAVSNPTIKKERKKTPVIVIKKKKKVIIDYIFSP